MKKILFVFCLTLLAQGLIYGGQSRVDQMGDGWLLPDALVDVGYNPARINLINGNTLDMRLSNFASFNNWETTIGFITTYPFIGYSGKFGGINALLGWGGRLGYHQPFL